MYPQPDPIREKPLVDIYSIDVLEQVIGPEKLSHTRRIMSNLDTSDEKTVIDISFVFDKPLYVKIVVTTQCIGASPTGPWWHIGSWSDTLLAFDSFYDQLKAYDGDIPSNHCLTLATADKVINQGLHRRGILPHG